MFSMVFSGVITVNVFNKHQALIPMQRSEKCLTLHTRMLRHTDRQSVTAFRSVQIQSFFWSVFSCIRAEYLVRIQENTDQEKLRISTLFTQCVTHKYELAGDSLLYELATSLAKQIIINMT